MTILTHTSTPVVRCPAAIETLDNRTLPYTTVTLVSRCQTSFLSAGRYRFQYKRPERALILKAITPCA